jgi:hypothetical protein
MEEDERRRRRDEAIHDKPPNQDNVGIGRLELEEAPQDTQELMTARFGIEQRLEATENVRKRMRQEKEGFLDRGFVKIGHGVPRVAVVQRRHRETRAL